MMETKTTSQIKSSTSKTSAAASSESTLKLFSSNNVLITSLMNFIDVLFEKGLDKHLSTIGKWTLYPCTYTTHFVHFILKLCFFFYGLSLLVFYCLPYNIEFNNRQEITVVLTIVTIVVLLLVLMYCDCTEIGYHYISCVCLSPFYHYWYYGDKKVDTFSDDGSLLKEEIKRFKRTKIWMNPRITHLKRLKMHTAFMRYFAGKMDARTGACDPALATTESTAVNVWRIDNDSSLNWVFNLHETVEDALDSIQKSWCTKEKGEINKKYSFQSVELPHNWQLMKDVWDKPIYTNIKYPFPVKPPFIPKKNPTGCYRVVLPSSFFFSSLKDEADCERKKYKILFHGVDSCMFVFLNGIFVGLSKDSRLPCEFELPLNWSLDEEHILDVVVTRFCDGSYVEDQDHWWLSGIHRNVEIIRYSPSFYLSDYQIRKAIPLSPSASIDNNQDDVLLQLDMKFLTTDNSTSVSNHKYSFLLELYSDKQVSANGGLQKGDLLWKKEGTIVYVQDNCDRISFPTEINKCVSEHIICGKSDKIKLWSAEKPNLYTLVISLLHNDQVIQVESSRIGFKSVQIDNSLLKFNGKPLTICGVNRHEHSDTRGKAIPLESIIQDVKLAKQYNFNAIRTSHYPNKIEFYRVCDFLGIYVVDEANIESHGMKPMGILTHSVEYSQMYRDRVERMYLRDSNFTCVTMWSLGNESGRGRNLDLCRAFIINQEDKRPIQYESGGGLVQGTGTTELTDVICTMYPGVEQTLALLSSSSSSPRPIILSEYSHSMGNSNGNMHLYWKHFWDNTKENIARLQGGFIWDYVDQGLLKTEETNKEVTKNSGKKFWAYGGDFDEPSHDAQFCINGLFFPNRVPKPALTEIKRLQQPIQIIFKSVSSETFKILSEDNKNFGEDCLQEDLFCVHYNPSTNTSPTKCVVHLEFTVQNRYCFSSLEHLEWIWSAFVLNISDEDKLEHLYLQKDHQILSPSSISVVSHDTSSYLLCLDVNLHDILTSYPHFIHQTKTQRFNFYLNIASRFTKDQTWTMKHHILAEQNFSFNLCVPGISTDNNLSSNIQIEPESLMKYHEDDDETVSISIRNQINGDNDEMIDIVKIDKKTGEIMEYYIPVTEQNEDRIGYQNILHTDESGESSPFTFNFSRASTDNDRGGVDTLFAMMYKNKTLTTDLHGLLFGYDCFSYEYRWKQLGLCPSQNCPKVTCDNFSINHQLPDYQKQEMISVKASCTISSAHKKYSTLELFHICIQYDVYSDGKVKVTCFFNPKIPQKLLPPSLPRIGFRMKLRPDYTGISYIGRGPSENYVDRKHTYPMNYWETTPSKMHTNYIVPGENGNREDVQYISFLHGQQRKDGLCIKYRKYDNSETHNLSVKNKNNTGFKFSTNLWTQEELHMAKHTCDLPQRIEGRDPIHFNIDCALMGVGGDTGWHPSVYPQYIVDPTDKYAMSFWMAPLRKPSSNDSES